MAIAPAAPFIAPTGGDIDMRLSQVAQVITLNLQQISVLQQQNTTMQSDITTIQSNVSAIQGQVQPTFLNLTAPDGHVWQLTVDATGALINTKIS
jgi:hypothetical protein